MDHSKLCHDSRADPDVTVSNVYFPSDARIKVHQNRVSCCPEEFPAGYYWYGGKRKGTGAPPRWVDNLLNQPDAEEMEMPESGEPEEQDRVRSSGARVSDNELDEEDTEPVSDGGQSVSDSDQPWMFNLPQL